MKHAFSCLPPISILPTIFSVIVHAMANILLRTLDHSFGQNLVKSKETRLISVAVFRNKIRKLDLSVYLSNNSNCCNLCTESIEQT